MTQTHVVEPAGLPDLRVSVAQLFGFDTDLEVPAYAEANDHVPDLDGNETGAEIKARYKSLVKLLHPDANGGDRSSEDRLRQIIQAYHYLKAAGFC